MSYESEFRIKVKELEFSGISHESAISQLSNIVKEADSDIEDLVNEVHQCKLEENESIKWLSILLIMSGTVNVLLGILA